MTEFLVVKPALGDDAPALGASEVVGVAGVLADPDPLMDLDDDKELVDSVES
jgi:hypothetical protein